jgi:hypothetical protein
MVGRLKILESPSTGRQTMKHTNSHVMLLLRSASVTAAWLSVRHGCALQLLWAVHASTCWGSMRLVWHAADCEACSQALDRLNAVLCGWWQLSEF